MTLLNIVLRGGVARHEGEKTGGRVTGGVGDPPQGVTHHHGGAGDGGHGHLVQRHRQDNILSMIVTRLK